ncbi:hypothetical protein F5Y16DRAFT_255272 [Xylariaceae sp. FL0255]|nr:hypothetical protein F5Y16DRAFT_255272 [Xylariaceae sp. FL0255]
MPEQTTWGPTGLPETKEKCAVAYDTVSQQDPDYDSEKQDCTEDRLPWYWIFVCGVGALLCYDTVMVSPLILVILIWSILCQGITLLWVPFVFALWFTAVIGLYSLAIFFDKKFHSKADESMDAARERYDPVMQSRRAAEIVVTFISRCTFVFLVGEKLSDADITRLCTNIDPVSAV